MTDIRLWMLAGAAIGFVFSFLLQHRGPMWLLLAVIIGSIGFGLSGGLCRLLSLQLGKPAGLSVGSPVGLALGLALLSVAIGNPSIPLYLAELGAIGGTITGAIVGPVCGVIVLFDEIHQRGPPRRKSSLILNIAVISIVFCLGLAGLLLVFLGR